jgi:hypothetical protein
VVFVRNVSLDFINILFVKNVDPNNSLWDTCSKYEVTGSLNVICEVISLKTISGNACYYSVRKLSSILFEIRKIYKVKLFCQLFCVGVKRNLILLGKIPGHPKKMYTHYNTEY